MEVLKPLEGRCLQRPDARLSKLQKQRQGIGARRVSHNPLLTYPLPKERLASKMPQNECFIT
jgi:hypothetical protein